MKKVAVASAFLLAFSIGTGFAAPMNSLEQGQTAVGVSDDSFYLEHKLTNNVTIGGEKNNIYGQFELTNNLRAIVGSRNDYSNSSLYFGGALNAALAPDLEGYVSLVGGSHFEEMQFGANLGIAPNVDLNVNYRSYMPEAGKDHNRASVGATVKF